MMISMKRFGLILLTFYFLLGGITVASAQTGAISGIILDKTTKEPLVGATVQVVGTTLGIAADLDGKYYLYFPLKDRNDIFRMGVAIGDKPEGPFIPQPDPIRGSYSIDAAVFRDEDGSYYMYFGGIWGGQLQRYRDNKAIEHPFLPEADEPALPSRVVKLSDDMLGFAEEPRPVIVLGEDGKPLTAGDPHRFFEASWMHKYKGKYYFSYSTGDTHLLCYAVGDNPYGPFVYQGVILTPVVGWTTHHSIAEYKGKWYLFHHDCVPSGGKTWLRSLKVVELEYDEDGKIQTVKGSADE